MNYKHFVISLSALTLCFSAGMAWTFSSDNAKPQKLKIPAAKVKPAVPATKAYGWLLRDGGATPKGLVALDLSTPATLNSLFPLADKAWAGAWANGQYYFYRYRDDSANQNWIPLALSTVDMTTGKVTDIASWSDKTFIFNDMAFDSSRNTMYALSREIYADDFLSQLTFEYSGLYKIDLATGVATQVKQFIDWNSGAMANPTYLTLAADGEGNIYSIDINGYLYKFDPDNSWAATLIGDTGRRPTTSIQSMDYDPATGKIFWAADYKNMVADLCMVDPLTAATKIVGALGNDSRLCGFHIEFDMPKEGAPGAPANLKVAQDASGATKATLSWENPSKTYGKANLASLTKIVITRNGENVKEFASPAVGAALSYEDAPSAAGYCTYGIAGYNALGKGFEKKIVAWVGRDVPDAPGNPGIGREDDGSAYVKWDAPTAGQHGGWFDAAGMKYRVTRMPDGKVVADNLTTTEFTDKSISTMQKYSYQIVAFTADGSSPAASTIEIALGNEIANFPYNCTFEDESVFNTWTVVNANGGSTWKWKHRGLKDFPAFAMYEYDNNNDADDYLITPPLQFVKDGVYKVKFNYRGSNASHTEKFEVVFGREASKEGMATVLKKYEVKTGDPAYDEIELPAIEEDGKYFLGFHATSAKKMYNLYITDVTISCTSGGGGGGGTIDPTELPAPTDLQAFVDNENKRVTLTWAHAGGTEDPGEGISSPINEDFESYPEWVINPSGMYDWHYIDGDKGIPYRSDYADMPYPTDGKPLAAMIMAPYELFKYVYEPNPPHSGDKYLLFKSNFSAGDGSRPAPAPDDYFISPKLNYSSDFVFSFWCKADPDWESVQEGFSGDDLWNKEQFRVGYSTSGREAADFKWLTDANEQIVSTDNTWKLKEYAIPAAAKYVCIRYCTPSSGFWFMVDDVYIGPARTEKGARAKAAAPKFKTFDIYLNEEKKATTEGNSHQLLNLEKGDYKAKVVAVYEEGESQPAEVTFTLSEGAVETIFSDDERFAVYTSSGIKIADNLEKAALRNLPEGIYLVRSASGKAFKMRK